MIPFHEFSSIGDNSQHKGDINDEETSMFDVFEQYISMLEADRDQNEERMIVEDNDELDDDSDDTMLIAQQRVTNNINLCASHPSRKPRASNPDQKTHRRLTVLLSAFLFVFRFRREMNRSYARKSRLRKRFFVDSLQATLKKLKDENTRLKLSIKQSFPKEEAQQLLSSVVKLSPSISPSFPSLLPSTFSLSSASFDREDNMLMKAIQTTQHIFVLTDPVNTPDNYIVFASQSFLDLTGYESHEVLGRNCRFLQGIQLCPCHF
jgi:PAS domain-containing protein